MNFYKKIFDLCIQHNILIKDLERELNFSNGIIGKWKVSSPNIKYLLSIADYFNISIEELCYDIDITQEQELLNYFHAADERGKSTIISIAELEARRSRAEKEQPEELQNNIGKKIDFTGLVIGQNHNSQKQEEDDEELKPFA